LYDSTASVMKIPKAKVISTGCQLNSLWCSITCAVGQGLRGASPRRVQNDRYFISCSCVPTDRKPVCADGPISCYILASTDTPQLMDPDRDNEEGCHSYSPWSNNRPTWTALLRC
jgi:hypothetical protein